MNAGFPEPTFASLVPLHRQNRCCVGSQFIPHRPFFSSSRSGYRVPQRPADLVKIFGQGERHNRGDFYYCRRTNQHHETTRLHTFHKYPNYGRESISIISKRRAEKHSAFRPTLADKSPCIGEYHRRNTLCSSALRPAAGMPGRRPRRVDSSRCAHAWPLPVPV